MKVCIRTMVMLVNVVLALNPLVAPENGPDEAVRRMPDSAPPICTARACPPSV